MVKASLQAKSILNNMTDGDNKRKKNRLVPKEKPVKNREMNRRHKETETEFQRTKREREKKKSSAMERWNQNRSEK